MKKLLFTHGFGYVWVFHTVGCEKTFLRTVRQRLIDCFQQEWSCRLHNSQYDPFYITFKSIISREAYLSQNFMYKSLRDVLIKFRVGVSPLYCHKYKFVSQNIQPRPCPACREGTESELHFLLICKKYECLRQYFLPGRYLSTRDNNSMQRLLSSEQDRFILAKYLYKAYEIRKSIVHN